MNKWQKRGWNDAKAGLSKRIRAVPGLTEEQLNNAIDYENMYDAFFIDKKHKKNKDKTNE